MYIYILCNIPVFKTLCNLGLDSILESEVFGSKYNYDNREKLKYILCNVTRTKKLS